MGCRFLYREGLPNRLSKNSFLLACFYCIARAILIQAYGHTLKKASQWIMLHGALTCSFCFGFIQVFQSRKFIFTC